MLDLTNKENSQIQEIENSNDYISFLDDVLEISEELSIFDMASVLGNNFAFPNINVNNFYKTTRTDKELEQYLINSYIDNENKPIKYSKSKKDIIDHFKPYFIANHDNLNEFGELVATTLEYNILSYSLYKGLCAVYPEFKRNKDIFKVKSIVKSDLLYKVSVELPNYISLAELSRKDFLFEDFLMSKTKGETDHEVKILMEKYNNHFVFSVSRFENKDYVSIADVLNYGLGYSYSDFEGDSFKIPVVLGLVDNEFPRMIDLSSSKNIAIIGKDGEGLGYSPLSYSIALNSILTTHYEDLNYIICCDKKDTFWKMFSRTPHVLGYHTDINVFKDVISDVYDLAKERLSLAKKKKCKTFKELQTHLSYDPQVVFVLDGLSSILSRHRTLIDNASEEIYSLIFNKINEIAKYSDITGVSILAISERGDKTAFPQEIVNNSILKVAMRNSSENDINSLFGVDMLDLSKPIGLDYNIIDIGDGYPKLCKTCSIGGLNDKQMLSIVRVIAFDWIRKSIYDDMPIVECPKDLNFLHAYTRNSIAKDSIEKIINGKVIPSW